MKPYDNETMKPYNNATMKMTMEQQLYRILVKGGVLSPSELKQVIELVESCGLDYFHFGSRQDILFPETDQLPAAMTKFPQFSIEQLSQKQYQNIVCSYVSADIFPSTSWLTGTTYLYILEQFRTASRLEINITDPQQRLVPLFTGNLNFIASPEQDYWYLYLDLPNFELNDYYPVLIHTWDIATIATAIEENYIDTEDVQALFRLVSQIIDTNNRTIKQNLRIPFYPFPYYEGMNKMGIDQYWLGLYWRNNRYDLSFLKALCDLCLESRIGKLCITPWKSFIVKGISKQEKLKWEKFLGRHGINVRHSSLELNWHLPVNSPSALDLKRFLVRNFDQNDISTYGLTFGISSSYSKKFTSIVIEQNAAPQVVQQFEVRPTFNVLHSLHFDPNTQQYKTYAQDVDKIELPGLLMELSQLYFAQFNESLQYQESSKVIVESVSVQTTTSSEVYQCADCLTVYDPAYGDAFNDIPAGTPFEFLPDDYCCPTCDAPKSTFRQQELGEVVSEM